MNVFTAKITKKLPIFMLIAVLIMLAIVGSLPNSSASGFPQSGNAFYGSVTNLEGGSVPYDPTAPTDPALTTMIYARDVTRRLDFDGFDAFSSGEYFGRPVTADAITGETRFGYSPQSFYFPAYDTEDPSSGAHNGDEIEFYICPPGREIPGVLVTMGDGSPLRAVFGIGFQTELNLSADIVPPAPEEVSPLDGAVDVVKDAPITILFDEDVSLEELDAFHIVGSASGNLLNGDPILEADGRTVTLLHFDFDDFGETVTVTIDAGAVSDGVGNLNVVYSWSFETYPYFFTISGNAGVAGAELKVDGEVMATADSNGDYSFPVENGWSGTVTPELEGYTFDPVSRTYTDVTEDKVDQNYTANGEEYLIYFPLFVH